MKKTHWLTGFIFLFSFLTSYSQSYQTLVKQQFEKRKADFSKTKPEVFSFTTDKKLLLSEKQALEFLYAYMSLNDIADYHLSYFKKQVKSALEAKKYFSWGEKVPDDLFRHFVLPPRVNNEDLDTGRQVFFRELKNRIKNMSMTQAALEVNHWCHEKVTYRPADGRTSSPLATMRTGFGRCGEESTFTVAALRSVGIPARQCYTPRWAHTDDNHAWVEVWADGNWHYMGACEPEAELNKAWFTFPAKRAMMVHTNVFGKYNGPELKTEYPLYTKINVLENYTDTKRLDVKVLDAENRPVKDAKVKFQLYNYAEYYTIYEQKTDADGNAYIVSGLGDLLVMASKGDFYNYQKVSLGGTQNKITLKLTRTPGEEYSEDMDITPPVNKAVFLKDLSENTVLNNIRLRYEDSLRNAYLSTFMTQNEMEKLAQEVNLDVEQVKNLLKKSEGNYREIASFIHLNAKNKNAIPLLNALTDKDLRDTPQWLLTSHLLKTQPSDKYKPDIFEEGVLSPRISTELIRDWRPYLQQKFKKIFPVNVTYNQVKNWVISNIALSNENYSGCLISPIGVEKIRKADKRSRDVFFVALNRSLGIPARIDGATGNVQTYEETWQTVSLEPSKIAKPQGKVELAYNAENGIVPQYFSYYSIAVYENGDFCQLDYENEQALSKFPVKLNLEEGYYRLTTGNRYPDGRVKANNTYFTVEKNQTKELALNIRELDVEKKLYGKVDASIPAEWYNKKGMVIAFLEPEREPTKHIMNDIPLYKKQFDEWNGNFVFVISALNLTNNFNTNSFKNLPLNSRFITSGGENIMENFLRGVNMAFRDNYPLLYVVSPKGEITFYSEGYRIGMGDILRKAIKMGE